MASSVASPVDVLAPAARRRSRATTRFLANRAALVAIAFLLVVLLGAVLAQRLAPFAPNAQDIPNRLQGPTGAHWLGTDALGRDVLTRLLYGARVSLTAAWEGAGLSAVFGIPLGLVAGYSRGRLAIVIDMVVETLMSVPALLLALAIIAVRGPGLTNAMLAIGVIGIPRFFRVARASTKSIANDTYIEAARGSGCSTARLLWRHVLPNASGPLLVQATFSASLAIAAEASLSFLGLGVVPPTASWGSMIRDSSKIMYTSSWSVYPPSVMIALTILAIAIVGDGLRAAFGRERARR